MRSQRKTNRNHNRSLFSEKGQTVVEFVLILSTFAVIMLAITAGLSRGFGIATKKYINMYDFDPTHKNNFKRFAY